MYQTPLIDSKSTVSYSLCLTIVAVFYFYAGTLSFSLSVSHDIVTLVVFFAEGGALAAAILLGPRIWPGIFIGQFVLAYTNGLAIEAALFISAINSIEAIIGVILFRKFKIKISLNNVRDVAILLLIITLVLQPFSATLGITTLWLFSIVPAENIFSSWASWWFGNSLGQALITPFILTIFSLLHSKPQQRELFYDLGYILVVSVSVYLLFFNFFVVISSVTEVLAIVTPLIIIIAAFRGQFAATSAALAVTLISLLSIQFNTGPFSQNDVFNWVELNIVLASLIFVSQFIAALFEERKSVNNELYDREQMLSSILDNSPLIICVNDLDGRFLFKNPAYNATFNVVNDEAPLDFLFPLASNECEAFNEGKSITREHIITLADGEITLYTVRFPVLNSLGEIKSIVSMSSDISNNKILEEQLRRSQKMEALGKLTGGIAHDYNNMLGVVLGYAEILSTMLEDKPELNKYVNEIMRAGRRGVKLTDKLLSFSRNKSSYAEIININNVLLEEQHMLEKTITARINLVLDLENKLWPVNLDESEFEDTIINISINAMHAINGNGMLTIRTRNESLKENEAVLLQLKSGDYVLLSISDTGKGMDEKTKEKIFEPFFSTKGAMGTGLGLSQVYGFVERCKGAIKVHSEVGVGTRLTLYFPRHIENNTDEDNNKITKRLTNSASSGTETILVVDDDTGLRNLTAELLRNKGYQVFVAESGSDALQLLEKEKVDLLFSDIIMPEMDGYQLAAIVKKKYPHVIIQLVSGFSDERHQGKDDIELYKNLLDKPYHAEKLLKTIRVLLD